MIPQGQFPSSWGFRRGDDCVPAAGALGSHSRGSISLCARLQGSPSSHIPCTCDISLSLSSHRCNTLQTNDPTYFKSCLYDAFFNPSCPVFRVRDMVEATGETFGNLALLVFAFPFKVWKMTANSPRVWA